jgi:lipoyl-dependent peroxiredoxin
MPRAAAASAGGEKASTIMTPIYTATATAEGGRQGHVRSPEGAINLPLSMPKELGGQGGASANPELLFAAGYAACFESALRLVARTQQVPLTRGTVTAKVTLGKTDAGAFELAVELRGAFDGLSRVQVEQLMQAAHEVCPYSRATRNNIEVKLTAEGA